jgi:anti-sigma factor RsiW
MNCTESRLLLHANADGELDASNSLELERHLKTCSACVAEERSLHSLQSALRQPALRYDAPDSLRREVRRIARAPETQIRPRLLQSLLLWKSLAFGAVAFLLLAILWQPGMSERDRLLNEAVASHVRSLMVDHLTDVVSSDQHTVKPWFNGKLDFAPDVRDFSTQGFPLVGGRLDYLNGRPVAAIVYQHNKHFINVFIWPVSNGRDEAMKTENRRGYSVVTRETNGLRYCLVSDLNEKEITELAHLLGR